MNQSENIQEIVVALAKAQGALKPAVFNRQNPHFKNRYADFTSCMDACRQPLSENGLAIVQYCATIEGQLRLVTMLAHTSGQWMKSEFPLIPAKMDSQGIGSAMTYAKRYSLCGMIGVVADEEVDDDGEAAVGRGKQAQKAAPAPVSQPRALITPQQIALFKSLSDKLDEESLCKISAWITRNFQYKVFEDLSTEDGNKIIKACENAVKFVEQKQMELANV